MTVINSVLAGGDSIDDCDVLRAGSTAAVLGHAVLAPPPPPPSARSCAASPGVTHRQLDKVAGGEDDTYGGVIPKIKSIDTVQVPGGGGGQHGGDVARPARQDDLGLGVTEADVELEDPGPGAVSMMPA